MIEEIKQEIDEQIGNMEYLLNHPNARNLTLVHVTTEYCRGALNMLDYLKRYIEELRA